MVMPLLIGNFGPHEAQHGLGWVTGKQNNIFYSDGGRIVVRNTIWVQKTRTVLVCMFERVGL